MTITYLEGDATLPRANGVKIIAHVCNTEGGWGRGFVLAVSKRWREPEAAYREWHVLEKPELLRSGTKCGPVTTTGNFGLGESQLVQVLPDTFVLNMIAQRGFKTTSKNLPLRYDALALCLRRADRFARELGGSLHMPRIGCGLSGGTWERVGPLVERFITVPAYVYDYGS